MIPEAIEPSIWTSAFIAQLVTGIVTVIGAIVAGWVAIKSVNAKITEQGKVQAAAIEVVRKDVNDNMSGMMKEVARHAMGKAVATGQEADMRVALNAEINAEGKAAQTAAQPAPIPPSKVPS